MRRVDCRACGVRVEAVPWGIGKHQLTKAYMLFLAHWARKLSWQETALSFRSTWDKVCQSVEYVVQWGLEHRQLGPIVAIGVDEIQYGKGHKYLTLVYQIEQQCTRLLWIGQERTTESFDRFFIMIGVFGHVETLSERHRRAVQPSHPHPRPLPYCREDERGIERCACCRGTPAGPGWLRTHLEKVPVVRTEAQGQPNRASTLPPARPAALQPEDRSSLFAEGGLPATLGV